MLLCTVGGPLPQGGEEGPLARSRGVCGPYRCNRVSLLCPLGMRCPASCQPCQICLGEKAKEEMNLVEILPPAGQEDKRMKPITIASLQASVLPMVSLSLSPGALPAQASPPRGHGHNPWGYGRPEAVEPC